MPLADVAKIVATEDAIERAGLVGEHLRRMETELDRIRAAVVSLRRLLRPDDGGLPVELRSVPARTVAGVEGVVHVDDVLSWYDEAMAELDAAVAGLPPLGPPGGCYANELFTSGRGAVLVYRPVADPPRRGRVRPVDLPPAEVAVVVHSGPHDDIDVTYGRLGAWVVDHALVVDGPVHETYLVGPRDDSDPTAWRTEIGWPVFRLASSLTDSSASSVH